MELHVDDDAFARAPIDLVYARLADPAGYGAWWPGVTVTRTGDDGVALRLVPPSPYRRALSIDARVHTVRPGIGLHLALRGDVVGEAEWWLEDAYGGTVVHHLLRADARRRPARTLTTYRQVLRRGMWTLKDLVQTHVREQVELSP